MQCLSDYKLKSRNEIRELLKVPGFFEYAMPIYNYVEMMKPGTVLTLRASEEKMPWLIKTLCLFIDSADHWREYEFNADYTRFRRSRRPCPKLKPKDKPIRCK